MTLRRLPPRKWATCALRFPRRAFHSHGHTPPHQSPNDVENAILSAAYKHVRNHGFSHQSLNQGARDAGYIDMSPGVLSDGVFSLIRFHLATQRLSLAQNCQRMFDSSDTNKLYGSTEAKLLAIIWQRLLGNKDIIHKWQDALAIMAQPSYAPSSIKELARLSDEIWYIAGDKSVDFSWYTKRASLSMIYSTSELFMTSDKSPEFIDTRNFLRRRLDEATMLGSVLSGVGTWTNFTMNSSLNVLRSKGVRLF